MKNKIAVIGAGTMGNGIAQVFAYHGFNVRLMDANELALQQGMQIIQRSLERIAKKMPVDIPAVLARITPIKQMQALADSDLIVEAATEKASIKEGIFRQLESVVRPDTILASNTSSISLTRIASWLQQPWRAIGMHFMNPVPVTQLIEIIRALQTSEATYQRVMQWAQALEKTPVTVQDAPGFVSNRVLIPMINEAAFALYEGLASKEDIDMVLKLGMGHPMGPLALADLIGLDVCLSIMDILYNEFRDSKYRACPLLVQLVEAGRLGRKTKHGFYQYD